MLLKEGDKQQQYRFLIRPNKSLTEKGMVVFVVLVGLAIFLVALRFVLLGAWVILPFAILEIGMLATGFWLYARASRYRETVDISKQSFIVTQESVKGSKTWTFNPHWVDFILRDDPNDWYPSRLFIKSHGEHVEIGTCLINEEREELLEALRDAMPNVLQYSV